jgi:hypothetical protein
MPILGRLFDPRRVAVQAPAGLTVEVVAAPESQPASVSP